MIKAISVRNIEKTINGKKILHDINFDVYEGEIFVLLGLMEQVKVLCLK